VLESKPPTVFKKTETPCFTSGALEQVGVGLEKIVVGSLRRVPKGEAPLLAWPLVCGSVVAERTRAVQFADAVLRVEVPDAGWQREMHRIAFRYLATLNRYGGEKVERIEFVISQGKQD
jgi:hypothetical protein